MVEKAMSEDTIDRFWKRTLSELAEVPMDALIEPAPEQSGREYTTSRVRLTGWGGIRIRGWYFETIRLLVDELVGQIVQFHVHGVGDPDKKRI